MGEMRGRTLAQVDGLTPIRKDGYRLFGFLWRRIGGTGRPQHWQFRSGLSGRTFPDDARFVAVYVPGDEETFSVYRK